MTLFVGRLLPVRVTQGDGDELLVRHSSGYATERLTDRPDVIEELIDARGRRDVPDELDCLASLVDILALARRDDRLRVEEQDVQRRIHVGTLWNFNYSNMPWTLTVRLTVMFCTAHILLDSTRVKFTVEGELTAFVLVERRGHAMVNVSIGTTSNGSSRPLSELLGRRGSTIVLVDGVTTSTAFSTDTVRAGSRRAQQILRRTVRRSWQRRMFAHRR
jgi:hypothetical protein